MQQLELSATETPGLSALSADARAAGDLKEVASMIFPDIAKKDPEKARNKLSDALRASHPQKLDIDEAIKIIVQAVVAQHRSETRRYSNSCATRLPQKLTQRGSRS